MLNLNYLNFSYLVEYGFSLLIVNILIYLVLLLLLFSIFFLFDLSKVRTLNEFKNFSLFNFIYISIFFTLLSLAGMPPLLGFLGKFLLIIFLLFKNQYFFFLLFSITNLFMIYFYIQNLRFMVKKTSSNFKISHINSKNLLEFNNIVFLVFFNFLNIFSIFFFSDFLIIANNLTISLYMS